MGSFRAQKPTFALPNRAISVKTHANELPTPRYFNRTITHKAAHEHNASVCDPLGDCTSHLMKTLCTNFLSIPNVIGARNSRIDGLEPSSLATA